MDWRATTNQTAQADLDQLLADSIQAAATGLSHQNLTPFMLVIDTLGRRNMRALSASATLDGIEAVAAALRRDGDADRLRARATVADVTVRAPFAGDAINVRLEHRDGPAIDILVPYYTTAHGITVDTEASTAAVGDALLWPAVPPE